MRYYLDTNILAFMVMNSADKTPEVSSIVTDYSNILYTSTVCVQELLHIIRIGRLRRKKKEDPIKAAQKAYEEQKSLDIRIVPPSDQHFRVFATLPLIDEHRDPNDRLIIAQALADQLPLISSDRRFLPYTDLGLQLVFNDR